MTNKYFIITAYFKTVNLMYKMKEVGKLYYSFYFLSKRKRDQEKTQAHTRTLPSKEKINVK